MIAHGPTDSGPRALDGLAERLEAAECRRVLLVTGRSSFEASGSSRILAPLGRFADVHRWYDFDPNTDSVDLAAGLRIFDEFDADAVVGIGGGSVMDMAKLLCAFRGVGSLDELWVSIRAGAPSPDRAVSLALAPTTSGSGSEATHFAVVYIGDEKFSIAGPTLRADFTALDPTLAMSGSPHQRATSGMDAVCQAIESRWATAATRRSRRYAEIALKLLLANIEAFVSSPTLDNSRAMQLGSHLAGRAIDISKTTAAHALSYGITKRYGVDHGNAAALTLGCFIEAHADAEDERLQSAVEPRQHGDAMHVITSALDARDGHRARENFTQLVRRLGLPSTLSEVGQEDADELDQLALSVNAERLGNNPVVFDTAGLRRVLDDARF